MNPTKIKEALEKCVATIERFSSFGSIGERQMTEAVELARAALAELSGQHEGEGERQEMEQRARDWWLKTIMLVDSQTPPNVAFEIGRSAAADQAVEMLVAFARHAIPLYRHPPARVEIGLTADEAMKVIDQATDEDLKRNDPDLWEDLGKEFRHAIQLKAELLEGQPGENKAL